MNLKKYSSLILRTQGSMYLNVENMQREHFKISVENMQRGHF